MEFLMIPVLCLQGFLSLKHDYPALDKENCIGEWLLICSARPYHICIAIPVTLVLHGL